MCYHPGRRRQSTRSPERNTGSVRFGIQAAAEHIRFCLKSLRAFLGPDAPLRVSIIDLSLHSREEPFLTATLETLGGEFSDADVGLQEAQPKKQYCKELRFRIYGTPMGGREMELIDG